MSILLDGYLKYQIAENAKPCKKTQYLLNIFSRKVACIKDVRGAPGSSLTSVTSTHYVVVIEQDIFILA